MITGCSNQHFSVKKIFQKHWNILKNDKVLGAAIPDKPVMIYRGAPSLRHSVAVNVIDPPKTISFFHTMKGFFPFRKCNICQINSFMGRKCETFQSTVTNKTLSHSSHVMLSMSSVLSSVHVLDSILDERNVN